MGAIEEKMDTFETEELFYNAKMSYGNMEKMAGYIDLLGEKLVQKETALQSLTFALADSVSAPKMEQIVNLSADYMGRYLNRFTTDEMREKLRKEGAESINAVLVDANFANEAIENGRDVFAIKGGKATLLQKAGEASEYEGKGYLIAVSPFTYEAEFTDDMDKALDD